MEGVVWGPKVPSGQESVCHFSPDHATVTKILDSIDKHLKSKVVKSFLTILTDFSEIKLRPMKN